MNEMIERVAAVIADCFECERCSEIVSVAGIFQDNCACEKPSWQPASPQNTARAAIEAMREPTEAMVKADMMLGGFGYGGDVYCADPKDIWTSMIDEALK